MECKNTFSRPGKVMDFRKNGQGHGKVMEFHFSTKYFALFENWKYSLSSSKICSKKVGFSAFLSHKKFKLVMKKS